MILATKAQIEKFIKEIAPIAIRQAQKHDNKLFPSVTIAQAAHESGWGTSAKMVKANALYGIKVGKSAYHFGSAWKGKAYKTGTTEYYDGKNPTKIVDFFRAYDNIEDATEDYMDMLCHASRYKKALNCSTPKESITAIVNGGYATGPEYASHIMATINSHNLTQYDIPSISSVQTVSESKPTSYPTLNIGSKGEEVKHVQMYLASCGYQVGKIDGIYGNQTKTCVKQYQADYNSNHPNKLAVDGIWGSQCWLSVGK